MKLGTIKRISKEDMARLGEVPKWMDPLLDTLNEFIEKITQAINGNLTFEDNFLCKLIDTEFESGVELILSPRIDGRPGLKPYGVVPVYTGSLTYDTLSWRILDNGNMGVTLGFSTADTAKCKLVILLR